MAVESMYDLQRRSNVPKFGDWEDEGAVPYTMYFDKARQARGAEKMTAQAGAGNPASPLNKPAKPAPEPAPRSRGTPRAGPAGNGGSSHSSEGRNARQGRDGRGFAPAAPGNSRAKPLTYSDDLDQDSAVPKFGEWNDKKADAGENYTEKFNKVLKERHDGATVAPYPADRHRQISGESAKEQSCCFPWSRK